ncbi:MAG: transglutaminase domain-containing protein [Bacteroidota bacterium]
MRNLFIIIALLTTLTTGSYAQIIDRDAMRKQDAAVIALGPISSGGYKDIVNKLQNVAHGEPVMMARAIYTWIATNVDFDCKAARHPKHHLTNALTALNDRASTAEGYTDLYKTLCDLAKIKCITIEGYGKSNTYGIGDMYDRDRHVWNAVCINNKWFLVDPTWAAGTTDVHLWKFNKAYTEAWFFPDNKLFAYSHFPDNKKMQYIDTPVTAVVYNRSPVVGAAAVQYHIRMDKTVNGNLTGTQGRTKHFVFQIDDTSVVHSVTVSFEKMAAVPAPYKLKENILEIDMPLLASGSVPAFLYVNNTLAFAFKADIDRASRSDKEKDNVKTKGEQKKDAATLKKL